VCSVRYLTESMGQTNFERINSPAVVTFISLCVFCVCFVCVLCVFCVCFVCILFVFCVCFVCVLCVCVCFVCVLCVFLTGFCVCFVYVLCMFCPLVISCGVEINDKAPTVGNAVTSLIKCKGSLQKRAWKN